MCTARRGGCNEATTAKTPNTASVERTSDPYDQFSQPHARAARAVLAEVVLAPPQKLLTFARDAQLASLLVGLLVALRYLLLEFCEGCVGRRSSGSGLVNLLVT